MALATGCAHYALPVTSLESPEAIGAKRQAHAEIIGARSSVAWLTIDSASTYYPPDPKPSTTPDPAYAKAAQAWTNPILGLGIAHDEKIDYGFRIQPGAPFEVKIKYQWQGLPKEENKVNDFLGSIAVADGLTLFAGVS